LVFTNRENYNIYHKIIKKYIVNYDNYIRNTIRRDNSFVLYEIFKENNKKWYKNKHYKYKNMMFKNYLYFTLYYCIDNESTNCQNMIYELLKIHGLDKNLHKKNVVRYIKWIY